MVIAYHEVLGLAPTRPSVRPAEHGRRWRARAANFTEYSGEHSNGDHRSPCNSRDAGACGSILYRAFQTLGESHNFPPDFPSVEVATGLLSMLLTNPVFHGVVAEDGGRVAGSNFADQRSPFAGIGPISVNPMAQNQGVGRSLMQGWPTTSPREILRASGWSKRLTTTVRSVFIQSSGFHTPEPLSVMQVRR